MNLLRPKAAFPKAALLMALTLSSGCARRGVTQDFGFGGILQSNPRRQAAQSPDASFRAIFKQQTQGTYDPLSDDPRVQALQPRLKGNPEDTAARLELGNVYEGYRLYDKAFDVYMEASRHISDNASNQQILLGLSRSARASHRTAEAIPLVEAMMKDVPTASSWNELGLLYQENHGLLSSEKAFREMVTLAPESDRAHNNLGYNLLLQSRFEEAEREFQKALESNPASATARNNLGTLMARRDDLEGALEQFQMTSDAATAHNNLAAVLLEMGQYERSREEVVKALAIRHYFAPALANFKLVQERMRDQAEVQKFGRLPLSTVRMPSAVIALEGIGVKKDPEDRQ